MFVLQEGKMVLLVRIKPFLMNATSDNTPAVIPNQRKKSWAPKDLNSPTFFTWSKCTETWVAAPMLPHLKY